MSTSLAVLGANTTAEMGTVSGAEDETVMMTTFNGRRRWSWTTPLSYTRSTMAV